MSQVKITDLVDQSAIDGVKSLNDEMKALLSTYAATAKELAKGIDMPIKNLADLEKFEKFCMENIDKIAETNKKLNSAYERQTKVIGDTTESIQRNLMEHGRLNKTLREEYDEHAKVKKLLDKFHDTYENQIDSLVRVTEKIKANKKAQEENEKAYKNGDKTAQQFRQTQMDLVAQHRQLAQEKKNLNQIMTAEEKAALAPETSYRKMSQELELLKP